MYQHKMNKGNIVKSFFLFSFSLTHGIEYSTPEERRKIKIHFILNYIYWVPSMCQALL